MLHDVFGAHPDVWATPVKEPHHFAWPDGTPESDGPGDRAFLEQVVVDDHAYRGLFRGGRHARHRVESSAMYAQVPGTLERLLAAVPDVRVVILLRDPAARAHSSWAYQRMRAFEPLDDFASALRAESQRLADGWLPIWAYRSGGHYAQWLTPWVQGLGDRLHVLFLEELLAAPSDVLRRLSDELELDPAGWPRELPDANPSGAARNRTLQRLLQWRPAGAGRLLRALPDPVVAAGRALRQRNVVPGPRPDPTTMAGLRASYRAGLDDLEHLVGRALPSGWRD